MEPPPLNFFRNRLSISSDLLAPASQRSTEVPFSFLFNDFYTENWWGFLKALCNITVFKLVSFILILLKRWEYP